MRRGVVVITGAGSGIGRGIALRYATRGDTVIASDIDEAKARETAAMIEARGGEGHAYRLDVTDAEACERFAAWVRDEHGGADFVVNSAGAALAAGVLDRPAIAITPAASS